MPEQDPLWFIHELTDSGNGDRFVDIFADQAIHVPGIGWYLWNGNVWKFDETDEIYYLTSSVLRLLRDERDNTTDDDRGRYLAHYERSSSVRSRTSMVTAARWNPRMVTTADHLDADPMLLVMPNGYTLNLGKREVTQSAPGDLCTRTAGVEFDPEAVCPHWLSHVQLVTQGDPLLAAYLQRWCGYTLTGLVSEQQFPFCFGGGNNGKNVFIETLMMILGDYAIRGSSKIITAGAKEHETIIADLAGIRMVYVDEAPQGRINEERIKELTGSKRIRARKIRENTFEFDARFKLWIAGNSKPRVRDTTEGFWRRVALVPFLAQIPAERRIADYAQRMLEWEGPGILNWCLAGLQGYQETGGLGEPITVTEARDDYRDEEDFVVQFLEECCVVTGNGTDIVTVNQLYNAFSIWAGAAGVPAFDRPHRRQFGRRVAAYVDGKAQPFQRRVDGTVTRGWDGVQLLRSVPID